MKKGGLFWRTIKHLQARQAAYQVINRLRSRPKLRLPKTSPVSHFLPVPKADKPVSWSNGTFTFLNQSVNFLYSNEDADATTNEVDWNYAAYGKLWTYNLNYFDFLNQPDLPIQQGLWLIQSFIKQTHRLNDGLEPYPTSLRVVNWMQFLSRNQIQDESINCHLVAQVDLVSRRLEYHLAGNHLLENGFALLLASIYFRELRWFRKASRLVQDELTLQIVADGGHDERSPMYHQILLDRLLDVLLSLQHNSWHKNPSFVRFLIEKADRMLSWSQTISFANSDIPMVNDAAFGIAPTTQQLCNKAEQMGFEVAEASLSESGYRMFRTGCYELLVDVGPVGPDHQPGHAHADTFSFVLYVDNKPIIVDNGTSTYETGSRRMWERSTAAHNTIEISGQNSSEVWAAFRVGRRAKVTVLQDTQTTLVARHDGYERLGVIHERSWIVEDTAFQVKDRLISAQSSSGIARFYFHPEVPVAIVDNKVVAGPVQLTFTSQPPYELRLANSYMSAGFNQLRTNRYLEIAFTNLLHTTVTILV